MKFVNFKFNQKATLGVFNSSGKVVNLADLDINVRDMNELIINFDEFKHKFKDLDSKTAYEIPKEDYLAPIIEPRQDIICLGINFLDHAKESAQFKAKNLKKENILYILENAAIKPQLLLAAYLYMLMLLLN